MMKSANVHLISPRPIWESSQRLLHPKCIWIESFGGHRHFIFDRSHLTIPDTKSNSPINHRQQSFASDCSKSFDHGHSKQTYLTVIGSDLIQRTDTTSSDESSHESNISNEKNNLNASADDIIVIASNDLASIRSTNSSNSNLRQISNEINMCKDLLADRVLQWLDLAENRCENPRKKNPTIEKIPTLNRRSFTAKDSFKSNDSSEKVRRESIHCLSMTFDDDATNMIQNETNPSKIALRFDQFFPTTYRCSRKFLSLRRAAMVSLGNIISNVPVQIEQKPTFESTIKPKVTQTKSGKHFHKSKRFNFFDDQYDSMIQRQILETSCNRQLAKRQLHIFMPNLPKKSANNEQNQAHLNPSINDCDSCISCSQLSE